MRQVASHPAWRRTIPTPEGPLAVLVAEPSGPGDPHRRAALLVPGFTGSKEDFAPLLGPLSSDGRRVVAMDQRGQYESPGPEHPAPYAMSELAADVLARLADGDVVALGGEPGGGSQPADARTDDDDAAHWCTRTASSAECASNTPACRTQIALSDRLTATGPSRSGCPAAGRPATARRARRAGQGRCGVRG